MDSGINFGGLSNGPFEITDTSVSINGVRNEELSSFRWDNIHRHAFPQHHGGQEYGAVARNCFGKIGEFNFDSNINLFP